MSTTSPSKTRRSTGHGTGRVNLPTDERSPATKLKGVKTSVTRATRPIKDNIESFKQWFEDNADYTTDDRLTPDLQDMHLRVRTRLAELLLLPNKVTEHIQTIIEKDKQQGWDTKELEDYADTTLAGMIALFKDFDDKLNHIRQHLEEVLDTFDADYDERIDRDTIEREIDQTFNVPHDEDVESETNETDLHSHSDSPIPTQEVVNDNIREEEQEQNTTLIREQCTRETERLKKLNEEVHAAQKRLDNTLLLQDEAEKRLREDEALLQRTQRQLNSAQSVPVEHRNTPVFPNRQNISPPAPVAPRQDYSSQRQSLNAENHPQQVDCCPVCKGDHNIWLCNADIRQIIRVCMETGRCIHCYADTHATNDCPANTFPHLREELNLSPLRFPASSTPHPRLTSSSTNTTRFQGNAHSPQTNDVTFVPVQMTDVKELTKDLPQFDGNPENFDSFYFDYVETVLENDSLTSHQRRNILRHCLTSEAKKMMVETRDAQRSVEETMDHLFNHYGNVDMKRNLKRQLKKLTFDNTSFKTIKRDIMTFHKLFRQMRALKIHKLDKSDVTEVLGKMPKTIIKHFTSQLSDENKPLTLDDIVSESDKFLKDLKVIRDAQGQDEDYNRPTVNKEVQEFPVMAYHQRQGNQNRQSQQATQNFPTNKDRSYNKISNTVTDGHKITMSDALNQPLEHDGYEMYWTPGPGPDLKRIQYTFPISRPAVDRNCHICGLGHSLMRCSLASSEVRKFIADNSLCAICLGNRHATSSCFSTMTCAYCSGKHNAAGCRLKEYYRDVRNYPANADKPRFLQYFRDQPDGNRR